MFLITVLACGDRFVYPIFYFYRCFMSESTEVIQEFLISLSIDSSYRTKSLELLETGESKYLRDMKLNFNSALTSEHLSPKEVGLIALSIAVNNENDLLITFFTKFCAEQGATNEEIGEATACASLLAANNVLYRFRHFTQKEKYSKLPARMRMQIMARPVTGKPLFELMSIAVSAVNGCEQCVNSHEDSLIKLDISEEKIFEAIRIASVLTSVGKIIR